VCHPGFRGTRKTGTPSVDAGGVEQGCAAVRDAHDQALRVPVFDCVETGMTPVGERNGAANPAVCAYKHRKGQSFPDRTASP
jgi:hypothetical protein